MTGPNTPEDRLAQIVGELVDDALVAMRQAPGKQRAVLLASARRKAELLHQVVESLLIECERADADTAERRSSVPDPEAS